MKVIFRKWRDTGEIIALFPDLVNPYNRLCESYMHVGQHSYANYPYVIEMTTPTAPGEYAALLSELKSIGYDDLEIRKRNNRRNER